MKDVEKLIKEFIDMDEIEEIDFKKVCGFYFAAKTTHTIINKEITSSEIKPVAIIYEENGQYYLAPIGDADEMEEVVKNFVEKCLKK